MCGIAGVVNYNALGKEAATLSQELKSSLWHRGPDEQSHLVIDTTLLVHTRLAIQDIQKGQQPFTRDEHRLIFNGQIYNHQELRATHLRHCQFRTDSDAETILCLYKVMGERFVEVVDGMFAIAIIDTKKKSLFLATDKAGKKPLYYYQKGALFCFASEINALKKIVFPSLEINANAIDAYLRCGFFPNSTTPYRDLQRFPKGSCGTLDLTTHRLNISRLSISPYFSLVGQYAQRQSLSKNLLGSFDEALEQTDQALTQSVKNRLISSDLEVGAFLSGGIDSTLICAMASRLNLTPKPLKTFTVSFNDGYDESHLAGLVAQKYETDHHTLRLSMEGLVDDIDAILYAYGEPFFDSSAIPSFYVAKEAKKYVNVVLNGDGADELFGGYRRYVAFKYKPLFKLLGFASRLLPHSNDKKSVGNYLYRAFMLAKKEGLEQYLSATTDIFEEAIEFKQNPILQALSESVESLLRDTRLDGVEQLLCLDFDHLLYSDLLKKIDIATMCHALESRSPFLSTMMMEVASRMPSSYKIRGIGTKYILRQLAKNYLPQELINAPKRGFEVPLKRWVDGQLKEKIIATLHNGYHEHYLPKRFVQDLLAHKINISDEKRAKMIWSIFCLDSWYNQLHKAS